MCMGGLSFDAMLATKAWAFSQKQLAAAAEGLSDVEDLLGVRQTSAQPLLGLEGLIGGTVLGEVVVPAEGPAVVDVLEREQLPDEKQEINSPNNKFQSKLPFSG